MIGELVDSLVAVFAPGAAAKRSHARRIYRHMAQRNYEAARKDRMTANWQTSNRAPDLELLGDADTIRARARDLVKNNAYARGIVKAKVRNIVGTGIIPQATTPSETFNDFIERTWVRWQQAAELTGRLSFYELQRLALAEVETAGEVLLHFVDMHEDRLRGVPLGIEMIDADRFAADYLYPRNKAPESGNEVRRGVEVDAAGRPVAYWLYPNHPQDLNSYYGNWRAERYSAFDFLHLFKQERVGQTRGVSGFAPIVHWLKQLGFYVDNELQASAVASCFSAAITTLAGPADGGLADTIDSSSSDTDSNQYEYMQPGMIFRLLPGEDVKAIDPARPNTQADAWINLMLRSMAVGTGLSYERLARDYSRTNFSSNRASDLEDRRDFVHEQQWLIQHLCEPVWRQFIEAGSRAELEGFPSPSQLVADYDLWTSVIWQANGWEWVDPKNEGVGAELGLKLNTTTLQRECAKKGLHWRDVLAQRRLEKLAEQAMLGEFEAEELPDVEEEEDQPT